jgi:hypothetical protein
VPFIENLDLTLALPEYNTKFCEKCGALSITQCPSCAETIRGNYHVRGIVGGIEDPPDFCHNCGKPYPWMKKLIEAATKEIDAAKSLNDTEKQEFVEAIQEVRGDSTLSKMAGHKIKKYVARLGPAAGEVIKEVVTKIASEAISKGIFGK